jgi:hypothetical protein
MFSLQFKKLNFKAQFFKKILETSSLGFWHQEFWPRILPEYICKIAEYRYLSPFATIIAIAVAAVENQGFFSIVFK